MPCNECYSIALSNGACTTVDADVFKTLGHLRWYALWSKTKKSFYAVHSTSKGAVYLHREIMNLVKGDRRQVDHINRDTLDNRRENLRIAERFQNQGNRPKTTRNTSGYKGVCWDKEKCKWKASINIDKKVKMIGRYASPEEAARAYDLAAVSVFGPFAHLNFPSNYTFSGEKTAES